MALSKKNKIFYKIITLVLILSIASILAAIIVVFIVGECVAFGLGGFCSEAWICYLFLIMPIATIIFGIVMEKNGFFAKRDIISGAVCSAVLICFALIPPSLAHVDYSCGFCFTYVMNMPNYPNFKDYKAMSYSCYGGLCGEMIMYNQEDVESFKTAISKKGEIWQDNMPDSVSDALPHIVISKMKNFDMYFYKVEKDLYLEFHFPGYYPYREDPTPTKTCQLYALNTETGHLRYFAKRVLYTNIS